MTIAFQEGFDLYPAATRLRDISGTPWIENGSASAVRVESFSGRRGTNGLWLGEGNNLNWYMFVPNTFFGSGTNHVRVNFSIKRNSTIYGSGRYAVNIALNFGGAYFAFVFDRDGKINVYKSGAVVMASTSFNHATSVEYPVSFFADYATGRLTIVIAGETIFDGFDASYVGAGLSEIRAGVTYAIPSSGSLFGQGNMQIDDIVVAFDGPKLGDDLGVFTLLPNSDGALQQWTPSTGTTGFNLIANPGTATFVEAAAAGNLSDFGVPNISDTIFTIGAVFIQSRQRKTSIAAGESRLDLRYNGSVYAGTSFALSTDNQFFYEQFAVNPVTGNPWLPAEIADIDGLRLNRTV